jgi:hypothetical protein
MSNENFRRELNRTFDGMAGQPSPALPGRVRSAIARPPEARSHYWIAAAAACVIAVLIVGVLFVAGPLRPRTSNVGGPVPSPSASPAASPSASPSPSPSPSAAPTASTAPFQCGTAYGPITQSGPAVAFVSDVRTGTHAGYDRITITFGNGAPTSVEVKTQTNATFTKDPSGQTVTLRGDSGLLLTIRGADEHTSYSGSTDFKTGYTKLQEAAQVQDFEGVVQWGIGLSGNTCYRVYLLKNPDRVVIDAQTGT